MAAAKHHALLVILRRAAANRTAREREHRDVRRSQLLPLFSVARLHQHATQRMALRACLAEVRVFVFLGPVHASLALVEAALRFRSREPMTIGEVANDLLGVGGGDLQPVQSHHSLQRLSPTLGRLAHVADARHQAVLVARVAACAMRLDQRVFDGNAAAGDFDLRHHAEFFAARFAIPPRLTAAPAATAATRALRRSLGCFCCARRFLRSLRRLRRRRRWRLAFGCSRRFYGRVPCRQLLRNLTAQPRGQDQTHDEDVVHATRAKPRGHAACRDDSNADRAHDIPWRAISRQNPQVACVSPCESAIVRSNESPSGTRCSTRTTVAFPRIASSHCTSACRAAASRNANGSSST